MQYGYLYTQLLMYQDLWQLLRRPSLQGNLVIPATCNKIGCLIFNHDYYSRITVSYEGSHSWKAHKMGGNAIAYEDLSSPPTSSQISDNYYSFYVWR